MYSPGPASVTQSGTVHSVGPASVTQRGTVQINLLWTLVVQPDPERDSTEPWSDLTQKDTFLYRPFFYAPSLWCMGAAMVGFVLSEFSVAVPSRFTLSYSIIFTNVSFIQTGRLVQPIVGGSFSFSVRGQGTLPALS